MNNGRRYIPIQLISFCIGNVLGRRCNHASDVFFDYCKRIQTVMNKAYYLESQFLTKYEVEKLLNLLDTPRRDYARKDNKSPTQWDHRCVRFLKHEIRRKIKTIND